MLASPRRSPARAAALPFRDASFDAALADGMLLACVCASQAWLGVALVRRRPGA